MPQLAHRSPSCVPCHATIRWGAADQLPIFTRNGGELKLGAGALTIHCPLPCRKIYSNFWERNVWT
jgi:hypothetical protein